MRRGEMLLMQPQLKSRNALPRHVAVLGAAGGLGQGILRVCMAESIAFTAIVRSRPERIGVIPPGSRVVVVPSLDDVASLSDAFHDADSIVTTLGVTSTSTDRSAFLSSNVASIEQAMHEAAVNRIVIISTLIAAPPSKRASWPMRFFSHVPGLMGLGAREQQAVVDALGHGALGTVQWTLVRGGLTARGSNEPPVAALDWSEGVNSWFPVSYEAMGRWLLEEAAAKQFVGAAPLVSRARRRRRSTTVPRQPNER
jgi:uncharacterized protein YbjT (DUF2867 family)